MDNKTIRSCIKIWCDGFEKDINEIIKKYGHISNWDVSGVTDMSKLFEYKSEFNENINNWNVSNVTDMNNMFLSALDFNQPLNKWNVSNVLNMEGMFAVTISFNHP